MAIEKDNHTKIKKIMLILNFLYFLADLIEIEESKKGSLKYFKLQ